MRSNLGHGELVGCGLSPPNEARPAEEKSRVFASKRSRVFAETFGGAVFYGDRTNDAHAVQH